MGFITNYAYDLATGAMVEKIEDADLSLLPDAPAGWSTPETGGAHLISNYESDAGGRTVRAYGPRHLAVIDEGGEAIEVRTVQFTVYRDDIRELWRASGYVSGSGATARYATVGPVSITRSDYAGRVTDQISARRGCECGPLTADEAFPQTCWTRWTKTIHDLWGRQVARCVYHLIPSCGEGERGEHYEETQFAYDSMGRQNRVVAPAERLPARSTMPAETPSKPGSAPTTRAQRTPTPPAPERQTILSKSNRASTTVARAGGEETSPGVRAFVGESGSDRITDFTYDFRDRLETTTINDGEADFITKNFYDNEVHVVQVVHYRNFRGARQSPRAHEKLL